MFLVSVGVCNSQVNISFIQNYTAGIKGGETKYTLTDSTFIMEYVGQSLIRHAQKQNIPTVYTTVGKLVNVKETGSEKRYYFNASYNDDYGFEIRKTIEIIQNYDGKGNFMTITTVFNTMDNSRNQLTTYFSPWWYE